MNQKGYKLFNLKTKRTYVSRDVLFYEHVFPYSFLTENDYHLFVDSIRPYCDINNIYDRHSQEPSENSSDSTDIVEENEPSQVTYTCNDQVPLRRSLRQS